MGAVQVFNEPFILAGGYGTDNTAMTAVSFIYYQFGQKRLGVAAVASWVLAFIIFVITMIQMYFDNRRIRRHKWKTRTYRFPKLRPSRKKELFRKVHVLYGQNEAVL